MMKFSAKMARSAESARMKSKQKGIVVTEQEIDNRINEIVKRQKMSLQNYRDMLKAKVEDFGQFKNKIRQNQPRRYSS